MLLLSQTGGSSGRYRDRLLFTPGGQEDRIGTLSNAGLSCDDIEATYEELNGRDAEFSEKLTQEHRQRYRSGFRGKRRNPTKYNKNRDPTHSCEVDEFATAACTGVRLFR